MNYTLLQLDDFAPNAREVREQVISGEFTTETGPDGCQYTGIHKRDIPEWVDLLSAATGRTIKPKLSGFRLNLAGELPHCWIHSDDICAEFASVLYLNEPAQCQGGTAFWNHTGLHMDHMPKGDDIVASGLGVDWFLSMMNREWKDLTHWEQCGFIAMKFNRLITYPVSRFHSRYPFEGFGSGPSDGRLIWVCFYDV